LDQREDRKYLGKLVASTQQEATIKKHFDVGAVGS